MTTTITFAQPKEPAWGFVSKIPKIVATVTGVRGRLYSIFQPSGRYLDFGISPFRGRGAWACTLPGRADIRVPTKFAIKRGIRAGDKLDWILAAEPGRPLHIQAGRRADVKISKKRSRKPRAGSSITGVPLGTRQIRSYVQRGSTYYQTIMPKECLRVLCMEDATHAAWERSGTSYRMVLCEAGHPGARKITHMVNRYGTTSYVVFFPKEVGRRLYAGRNPMITWRALTDGHGWWEVRVRADGRK